MAVLSLHHLASLLIDAAGPLLSGGAPAQKDVDASVKKADGQTQLSNSAPAEAAAPSPAIAAAVGTAQVVRLAADPPVCWDQAATAWTCPESTTLVVTFADGLERTFEYPAGTVIPVAAGMIHFPQCPTDA